VIHKSVYSDILQIHEHHLASFVSALTLFFKSVFTSDEDIEIIRTRNYSVAFRMVGGMIICYIYQGSDGSLWSKLQKIHILLEEYGGMKGSHVPQSIKTKIDLIMSM